MNRQRLFFILATAAVLAATLTFLRVFEPRHTHFTVLQDAGTVDCDGTLDIDGSVMIADPPIVIMDTLTIFMDDDGQLHYRLEREWIENAKQGAK